VEALKRVFVAVPVPDEVRMSLADTVAELAVPGRRVPPANWHITTRFLGEVDQLTYERFLMGLSDLEDQHSFPLSLNQFGAFPNHRKATVFWAGVGQGVGELAVLNEITEEAAQAAGLAPEDRPFRPHLTLARIRPPRDVHDLVDEALDLRWRCHSIVVFQTRMDGGAARYEPLEVLTFTR
jgi:2'-5' RNA ligase